MNHKKPNININIHDLSSTKCPKCSCIYFTTVWQLKTVPAVLSKTGKEEIFPLAGFQCTNCKHVLEPVLRNKKDG
jgi:hypothetical protein